MTDPGYQLRFSLIDELFWFRTNLTTAPGHSHLYDRFESLLNHIKRFRESGAQLDTLIADHTLMLVRLLVEENNVGRRPWTGQWESYFSKCLDNACRLLSEYCQCVDCTRFIPLGYAQYFAEAFRHMDHNYEHYAEAGLEIWSCHFLHLAKTASKMFSMTADRSIVIDESWLEHPDDEIFTLVLTGFARTGKAKGILEALLEDDEPWVRSLAVALLKQYHNFVT